MIPRRFRLAAILAAVLTVAISLGCVAVLGTPAAESSAEPVRTADPQAKGAPRIPADGEFYFGVSTDSGDLEDFDTAAAIKQPAILGGFISDGDDVSSILGKVGRLPSTAPMVSWGLDFTGHAVVSGRLDGYLERQARAVAGFGKPVFIRLDWEMNALWYPEWSQSHVAPADYVAAWRHVRQVFRAAGATNAAFVWAPNAGRFGALPDADWYPGDGYVDWVGVDAYPTQSTAAATVTGADGLDELAVFGERHGKPVMLAEWAPTAPQPDSRQPFELVFEWTDRHPRSVKALVYFNYATENRDHLLPDFPSGARTLRSLLDARAARVLGAIAPVPGPG